MRIGINAQRLAGQRLGVGRYIEYMLKYWDKLIQPQDCVNIYVQEPFDKSALGLSDACQVRHIDSPLKGVLWENLLLPSRGGEFDVLFCPSYTTPLPYRGRSVVAIHSLNEAQSGTHPWWHDLTYTQRYRLAARQANKIIVPSYSTRDDMIQHYGIPPEKIEVVEIGVHEAFHPLNDEALIHATRQRYVGADRPYIVFVGKLSQRRNIPTMLKAFSILKQRENIPHSLLLVGPNHLNLPLEQLAAEYDIKDSLAQTDGTFADHSELVSIYNAADLFISTSLYEGFSMPLIEAMACGIPVVVTNRAALGEIAGNYGCAVDDPTAEAFADAMYRVLSDHEFNQSLRGKSLERARFYRWENCAGRTLDIVRQAALN